MKGAHLNIWQPLTADGNVRWLKYSFGPGTANSLAVKPQIGGWLVVSPPAGAPASVFETLEQQGDVSALVAPNAYHNLGQPAWRARFPRAVSFAPSGAHARLSKKTPGVPYRPIEELAHQIRPSSLFLPEGMKTPDILVRIPTNDGFLWWMGDQFSNSSLADQIWPLRLLARFVGSGLGYRCNSKPELVYVRDRAAWIGSIRKALEECPPTIVVPAHGDPVTEEASGRTRRAIDAIDAMRRI
jgi:hypothetical protein